MSLGTDEVEERVRADIERHGWHVALVPGDDTTPGWAHSIGLHERFGHAEVLCFGPELVFLHGLVNRLGERVRSGERLAPGAVCPGVLESYPVAVREVLPKWYGAFLGNAAWHYKRDDFPAVQCFWPDRFGLFPWDAGFDPKVRDLQPLLFEQATHRALSEAWIESLRAAGAL